MKNILGLALVSLLISALMFSACSGGQTIQVQPPGSPAPALQQTSETIAAAAARPAGTTTGQPATPAPGRKEGQAADGHVGGKVKEVNGLSIYLEDPQGKVTKVLTDANTIFSADGKASSLQGVVAGKSIEATGKKQGDGSWLVSTVEISDRPPVPPASGTVPGNNPPAGNNQGGSGPSGGQKGDNKPAPGTQQNGDQYSVDQAVSDEAQLSTIAFSGLAFITGSSGADTFFPPGKVADFFGFQYMRDVDTAGYGHNTLFLSQAANNVLYILNDAQKAKLVALAKQQAPLYVNFAYNRFLLTNAFRRNLEGNIPAGSGGLDTQAVAGFTGGLYLTDADISYNRAVVVGEIIRSFTSEQKAYLAKMQFNNYASWPDIAEDASLKKSLNNNEFVAVMTYASELFSWYKGGLDADVYFCPERHGTYFGGFYMKDYPAMNNPDYFISTAITGDSGKEFLNILNTEQRALITGIIEAQRPALKEIVQVRTTVSTELRKAMGSGAIDKDKVYNLIKRYGELDGQVSALYASRFAAVNKSLTDTQRAALIKLRNLSVVPQGAYLFSTPVAMPSLPSTDFMFGAGSLPSNAGQITPPSSFGMEIGNRQGR
jgi:hypothetical protein